MGSSKSQQSTSNADRRAVADNGSASVTGDGNTVQITDGGLIEKGLAYLGDAEKANTDRLALLIGAGGKLVETNQQLATQSMASVLEAKKAADEPASQKTMLNLAMIAAGAIVIAKVIK